MIFLRNIDVFRFIPASMASGRCPATASVEMWLADCLLSVRHAARDVPIVIAFRPARRPGGSLPAHAVIRRILTMAAETAMLHS